MEIEILYVCPFFPLSGSRGGSDVDNEVLLEKDEMTMLHSYNNKLPMWARTKLGDGSVDKEKTASSRKKEVHVAPVNTTKTARIHNLVRNAPPEQCEPPTLFLTSPKTVLVQWFV